MPLAEIINVNKPIIPTTRINMFTPIIDPALAEAVGPSLVGGESDPLSPPLVGDEGAAEGALETAGDLHWLRGGVLILQAPGRARARVRLIEIPSELLVVVNSWQRQGALVLTTEARAVQQPCDGLLLGPPCKKARHGAKLTREALQDDEEELGGDGD